MPDKSGLEKKLRAFIKDELMISQIDFVSNQDDLDFDSLAQTELRIYLEEEYDLDINLKVMSSNVVQNLDNLIAYISNNASIEA